MKVEEQDEEINEGSWQQNQQNKNLLSEINFGIIKNESRLEGNNFQYYTETRVEGVEEGALKGFELKGHEDDI